MTTAGFLDDHDLINEVTQLGLKYNLMTNYTSFIAIDSEIRNSNGKIITVEQPLPLPQGVSNYAAGSGYRTGVVHKGRGSAAKSMTVEMMDQDAYELTGVDIAYSIVQKEAEFKGGNAALEAFIEANLVYPEQAYAGKIEGTVFIELTIEEDGSISEVKILLSTHHDFDNEAIRLIKLTDKMWIAAELGDVAIRSKVVVPVNFRIR